MTFYCLIGQEMLNFVTNCCKLLKVNQAAERAVSSTAYNGRKLVNTLAPSFLAHLSRRLKGELIVYRSFRRPCVRP